MGKQGWRAKALAAAWVAAASGAAAWGTAQAGSGGETPVVSLPPELRQGRELLKAQRFEEAGAVFKSYLKAQPGAVQAQLGLGDAEVGLHQFETAEMTYRAAVATQPELWQAHKDLVLVEAKLGRWEEFDRERTVLRMARDRRAPGIGNGESDLIDSFDAGGGHWVVRAYPEPVGRSRALYNFERFSSQGRVEAYLSLEDEAAAKAALTPGDVRIGSAAGAAAPGAGGPLALNWYTGSAHGTIRHYPAEAPPYEQLRAEVHRWLRANAGKTEKAAASGVDAHRKQQGNVPSQRNP